MRERCKRGHDLTDPENVYVRPTGYTDCRACWRLLYRRRSLAKRYGITPDEYARILHEQGNICGICGTYDAANERIGRLSVDHDHETNEVRGLLCHNCNLGLGHFKDEIRRLRAAIHYLETHRE